MPSILQYILQYAAKPMPSQIIGINHYKRLMRVWRLSLINKVAHQWMRCEFRNKLGYLDSLASHGDNLEDYLEGIPMGEIYPEVLTVRYTGNAELLDFLGLKDVAFRFGQLVPCMPLCMANVTKATVTYGGVGYPGVMSCMVSSGETGVGDWTPIHNLQIDRDMIKKNGNLRHVYAYKVTCTTPLWEDTSHLIFIKFKHPMAKDVIREVIRRSRGQIIAHSLQTMEVEPMTWYLVKIQPAITDMMRLRFRLNRLPSHPSILCFDMDAL
jgi:hypothetical protein